MNCNLEYRIELFLGISELSDIFRDIILSEKDEPILNMTLIYVTHVRIYQRPLLIAQQPQRTSMQLNYVYQTL